MPNELSETKGREEPRGKSSKLALVAIVLSLAALLSSGLQAYYSWSAHRAAPDFTASRSDFGDSIQREAAETETDPRTKVTLAELARRAPTIRTGSLQAWWAGEQARQVQRLEAQAKRQTLAGDHEGAARSVSRADAIRSGIGSLADYEKLPSSKVTR
jgi:hypothetical protein